MGFKGQLRFLDGKPFDWALFHTKPTRLNYFDISAVPRHSRSQHQLAAGVAQFDLSERFAHVVEGEDSGNRHVQLTPCDEVGQFGEHGCACGVSAAF
jgi:hypothetical protein